MQKNVMYNNHRNSGNHVAITQISNYHEQVSHYKQTLASALKLREHTAVRFSSQ